MAVSHGQINPVFCLRCGYSLFGSTTDYCPECGRAFDLKEFRAQTEWARECVPFPITMGLTLLTPVAWWTSAVIAYHCGYRGVSDLRLGMLLNVLIVSPAGIVIGLMLGDRIAAYRDIKARRPLLGSMHRLRRASWGGALILIQLLLIVIPLSLFGW